MNSSQKEFTMPDPLPGWTQEELSKNRGKIQAKWASFYLEAQSKGWSEDDLETFHMRLNQYGQFYGVNPFFKYLAFAKDNLPKTLKEIDELIRGKLDPTTLEPYSEI